MKGESSWRLYSGTKRRYLIKADQSKHTFHTIEHALVRILAVYNHFKLGLIFRVGLILQPSLKILIGLIIGVGLIFGGNTV